MNRHSYIFASLMLLLFSLVCSAQNPVVDPAFEPALSRITNQNYAYPYVQPDGKVIIIGNFQTVNSSGRFNIARLNTDGTTDTTFNCPACAFNISSVAFQPDGKILVGGREYFTANEKLIRVNADGSVDTSFNYAPVTNNGNSQNTLYVKGVQSDGKILVTVKVPLSGNPTESLIRLNTDGSKDSTFQNVTSANNTFDFMGAKILPDGRIFVFGKNPYGSLAQVNSDGTKNALFESPALSNPNAAPYITDIALQTDGKIAFVGTFTSVNGLARAGIARLNSDQTVDTTFNPTFPSQPGQIFAVSNNKLLVASQSSGNSQKVFRINYDGSVDNTFNMQSVYTLSAISLDSSERIYFGGALTIGSSAVVRRFNADGSLDASYLPEFLGGGSAARLGLQPDGKILVGGIFDKTGGINRKIVSRLNADGTVDATFDSGTTFNNQTISDFAVQTDGKILVGVTNSFGVRRLNSNGSLDTTFNLTLNSGGEIQDVEILSDGKILIGGIFTTVNGTSKNSFARLNADGSLDTTFNVQLAAGSAIRKIIVQSDGKIMIAGTFSGVGGVNRSNVARLNSDGSVDTSFNAAVSAATGLLISPTGKYLVNLVNRISRLNSDGSVDGSFQVTLVGTFTSFVLLDDGTIVASGLLSLGNFTYFVRFKSDGSIDNFSFIKASDNYANAFLKQSDGKVLAGGLFQIINGIPRTGLARLTFTPAVNSTAFDFDLDGRADIGVFRPSNNVWYQLLGANYQYSAKSFGEANVKIVPADYDGDGKTDFGIWRPATGEWVYISSGDNVTRTKSWGVQGDIPLPSDINGDRKADFVVFRPSTNTWYRLTIYDGVTQLNFGLAGDKPLIGDFDGDGKADYAVYRPSTGVWWYAASSANNEFRAARWGVAEDVPVPADYDGDGKTDFAVFRPSNGAWYIANSNGGTTIIQFGLSGDRPVAADYDGDGKADIAVFRPSNGGWYQLRTTAGFTGITWGTNGDIPIPNAFIQQ